MALMTTAQGAAFVLRAEHTFGRLPHKVDTVIPRDDVSRVHALLDWSGRDWYIKDLSTNGTWLNDRRLVRNQAVKLVRGDKIQVRQDAEGTFRLLDASAPTDVLMAKDTSGACDQDIVQLHAYMLLPEDAPEVAIYQVREQWCLESIEDRCPSVRLLRQGDTLRFGGRRWSLNLSSCSQHTEIREQRSAQTVSLHFALSLDEEHVRLEVHHAGETRDLGERCHFYLLVILARYRYAHLAEGLAESEQGWVSVSTLCKDLGLSENTLNIHLHRCRKQLASVLPECDVGSYPVERSAGRMRLNTGHFSIIKGGEPECDGRAVQTLRHA